jgi:two-component system sensor histidine kinase UhpB
MTSPQLLTHEPPQAPGLRRDGGVDWRGARERVFRVPLVAKLLGANALIAFVGIGAAIGVGNPNVAGFICVALALSFALNAYLVRLALSPLVQLEDAAERVSRGEWYARITRSPLADRRVDRVAATINRLLDAVSADRQHIHEVIQRSIGARDAERAALARQLREETAQALYGLELQLGASEQDFGGEDGLLALHTAQQISSQALDQVRALADTVYPGLLQELGLPAALKALAVRVGKRTALKVSVATACATIRISPPLILTMYHVAEEAVRNVEQHAHASSIEIRLSSTPTTLHLDISDDGVGFDPTSTERGNHAVGLFQLREMLSCVHGELRIESAPRSGTHVTAIARLDQGDTA